MFQVDPLTDECAKVHSGARHVCIGVSPFNSYFTIELLTELASWGLANFQSCHFFVPDEAAAYTLEALGYEPTRARQKARRQGRYVYNKIHHALDTLLVGRPQDLILDMERLNANEPYVTLRCEAEDLFENDLNFRAECLEASNWVLDRKLPDGQRPTEEQLRLAVRYFLAELPLFAGSGKIVGQPSSMFVYHQRVAFLEKFYHRGLSWLPQSGQGFLVVTQHERKPAGALVETA